jgi:hypothetical protein
VEDGVYDHARVYANGNLIWENPAGGGSDHLEDTSWTLQEYDISEFAAFEPSVVVRFELQSDGGLQFGGWNIDDFALSSYDCEVIHDPTRPTATPGTPTETPTVTATPSPGPTNTPGTPIPVSSHTGLMILAFALGILILATPQIRAKLSPIIRRIDHK